MVTLLLRLLRLLPLLFGAHRHVALENLALRHQLAVYKRTLTRPKPPPLRSKPWEPFPPNPSPTLAPSNFFKVPTPRRRPLFVLVVLPPPRRRVVHFNVTEPPTAHWPAQQIVDAFPDDSAPAYLL